MDLPVSPSKKLTDQLPSGGSPDQDTAGTSVCYGDCAVKWPPYIADNGAAMPGLTTIERKDGAKQWAKDGKPLYFWMGDTQPGETNGDGVGGVWHVAH